MPNFPERVLQRKRYRRRYIYFFFFRKKASATSIPSFFSLRVSQRCTPGVTGVNSCGNCSWKISCSDPSIIDPDGNRVLGQSRSRDCSLQFVRVKNWRGLETGRGKVGEELEDLKRECDRCWQADCFRLRQRRDKRKREIFHGLYSVVAIACYFSGERFSFVWFFYFPIFSDTELSGRQCSTYFW